jgi:hypothetical protein
MPRLGSALQPSRGGRGVALLDDRQRIAFQGLEPRSVVVAPESQIEDVFTDLMFHVLDHTRS